MELLLVLDGNDEGSSERDVAVGATATTTVAELQEALAAFARDEGLLAGVVATSLGLHREGDRDPLPPAARVVDSGLVDGDVVALRPLGTLRGAGRRSAGEVGEVGPGPGVVLDVIGGPDGGRSVRLELGALTVGRSPRCRLTVDDPTLSRHHFTLQVAARWGGGTEVTVVPDATARNGIVVDGQRLEQPRAVDPGEPLRAGDSLFVLRTLPPEAATATGAGPRRRNLGGVRSAPVRAAGGALAGRRFGHQRTAFYQRVEQMAARVDQALRDELAERHAAAPDLTALARGAIIRSESPPAAGPAASSPSAGPGVGADRVGATGEPGHDDHARLRPQPTRPPINAAGGGARRMVNRSTPGPLGASDPGARHAAGLVGARAVGGGRVGGAVDVAGEVADGLTLRLGLGEVASRVTVGVAPGGVPELRQQAVDRLAYHRTVRDAPVTVDLHEVGALGLCGDPTQVLGTTGALLLQAACRHGPGELAMAAAIGEPHLERFEWLKWLPHLRAPLPPLRAGRLATDPAAAHDLVQDLLDLVADRLRPAPGRDHWPRVLVAIDETAEVPRWLLDRLLGVAPDHGIHVVWFGEPEPLVPRRCGAVVLCGGGGEPAVLRRTDPAGGKGLPVEPDGVRSATARSIARRLAARWSTRLHDDGPEPEPAPGEVTVRPFVVGEPAVTSGSSAPPG